MIQPKIVVLTPVKNESWILDRFLLVTSQFADLIIIADQGSTDESISICRNYPKVVIVENQDVEYDEASRQNLLIQKARELVPEHKILLALDADEVLAANAVDTIGWQSMLKAPPGTVLCFEKPDLLSNLSRCIRHDNPWPLGYVDDGAEHKPKKVHSIRVPMPEHASILLIHDVKILHYAFTRQEAQLSKARLYSVVENVLRVRPVWSRRRLYSQPLYTGSKDLTPSEPVWFVGWEEVGIDMKTIVEQKYHWQDYEVLRYFHRYGVKRFWIDEIWNFDWEECRKYAKSQNMKDIPDACIIKPPKVITIAARLLAEIFLFYRRLKGS